MGLFGKRRQEKRTRPRCCAVVPAAGSSTRMGGENKLFMDLSGAPVIAHTLGALCACPEIDEIVVAAREQDIMEIGAICREYGLEKVKKVVRGGENRTESVYAGLMELSRTDGLVAVHDAARPLVSSALISSVIERAGECGAAAPAVPVKDTIKLCRDGFIDMTPERSLLFAVQTPQVFDLALLKGALTRTIREGIFPTDDCGAVEALGMRVAIVPGEEENLKITTPADLISASCILEGRK